MLRKSDSRVDMCLHIEPHCESLPTYSCTVEALVVNFEDIFWCLELSVRFQWCIGVICLESDSRVCMRLLIECHCEYPPT